MSESPTQDELRARIAELSESRTEDELRARIAEMRAARAQLHQLPRPLGSPMILTAYIDESGTHDGSPMTARRDCRRS
jgi:hypothetical protein